MQQTMSENDEHVAHKKNIKQPSEELELIGIVINLRKLN